MAINQVPHSLEAEQAVIAAAIIDGQKLITIKEKLLPFHFYNQINALIYEALVDIIEANQEIDFITINDQLVKNKTLDKIGDINYILELAQEVSLAINVEQYVEIVYEKYLLRETITRATNIVTKGYDVKTSSELIEYAEQEIFNLAKMTRSEEFVNWENLIDEMHSKIEELIASGGKTSIGLATGFSNLDGITNGLHKSDLIILAARPSVGKTAFALNIARNALVNSANNNPSVAMFSLEMGAEQLLWRVLAMQSGVPITNIRTGQLDQEQQELIDVSLSTMKSFDLHVDETPGIKIGDLKSKSRKLKLEKGLDLIIIDYLQLITTANPTDNRQQEVSLISRELKGLAKELQVPIIALSQLSRGVEQRADKKPMMSDIRESGAIEQDADIIMMLYRPEYYGDNIELSEEDEIYEGKTQLIIAKHRNGATGEIEFKFEKEINKFLAATGYE